MIYVKQPYSSICPLSKTVWQWQSVYVFGDDFLSCNYRGRIVIRFDQFCIQTSHPKCQQQKNQIKVSQCWQNFSKMFWFVLLCFHFAQEAIRIEVKIKCQCVLNVSVCVWSWKCHQLSAWACMHYGYPSICVCVCFGVTIFLHVWVLPSALLQFNCSLERSTVRLCSHWWVRSCWGGLSLMARCAELLTPV